MSDLKVKFGKIFWPSLIASIIVSIVGTIIFIVAFTGVLSGIGNFESKPVEYSEKTVLHLKLDNEIAELGKSGFNKSSFSFDDKLGLNDLLNAFKTAAKDEKIKGIFIELDRVHTGYTTAREIRNAINEFEKSGKFVIAYNSGEVITQKSYYIASAANTNYAFPTSTMEVLGLGTEIMYFKKLFDNLGIEMQVIRGRNNDFKSAVEPFFRENMSDSSRLQMQTYLNGIWSQICNDIATDRKINPSDYDKIAENALVKRGKDALKYKLIDGIKYRDEVIAEINKKLKTKDEANFLSFEKYAKKKFYEEQTITKTEDPNIAVIVAEGEISKDGNGMTSKKICALFQEVRKNNSIKTVVFRINSPGGSALASDEIWREVKITNQTKKVIVSMGDVAASGGYYIAAPCEYIFAEPTTITGSIGVFGMIPYTGKMLEEKVGLTFDRVSTNAHSILSLNKKLTEEEHLLVQEEVESIYNDFLERVSEGRGMSKNEVNVIARGRVWTGIDALRIGLVDELGGIDKAIEYAAKKAKIKSKKVLYYPNVQEDKFGEILEQIGGDETEEESAKVTLSAEMLNYLEKLKRLDSYIGIQMRMPYEINLK